MEKEKRTETTGCPQEQSEEMKAFALAVKNVLEKAHPSASVEILQVTKNNARMLTGIVIHEEGHNIAPTIYLDDFLEQYRSGKPLDEICQTIEEIHQRTNPGRNIDTSSITSFSAAKEKICYKLVNAKKNSALLQNVPHRLWQDLAVVYYISMPLESVDGFSSIMVENRMQELWEVDENTLYEYASRNTPALFGAEIMSITEVMNDMFHGMGCPEVEIPVKDTENVPQLYVATNDCKTNGAAVILYDGVLEKFAEQTGSDFFILPSSIHETLFMPVLPGAEEHDMPGMVREVNMSCLAPEEILSDNAYIYCAKDHSVRLIS